MLVMLLENSPAGIITALFAQTPHRAPGRRQKAHQHTSCVSTRVLCPQAHVTLLSNPCSTTRQDVQKEDDVEEQDDEDPDGEEEDKDDGSTHATVVADLAETTKLKGEREALESERRNQTNQAKMKAGATTETRRGRQEAEYLPQENQRSDATSLSTRN